MKGMLITATFSMKKFIQYRPKVAEYDGEWQWKSSGMGYIFQANNGHFVIIDGGMDKEDPERIINLLKEYSDDPVVDLWIITHPHKDHCNALIFLSQNEDLKKQITINALCYNNPESFEERCDNDIKIMDKLPEVFGCKYYKPQSDDVIQVDDIKIHFYFVWSDIYIMGDSNDLSMIFDVGNDDFKVMITGDTAEYILDHICNKFADRLHELKSDMVQLPHHGLDGGSDRFFAAVGADTVLVPISMAGYRVMIADPEFGEGANARTRVGAKKVYYSSLGTCEIDIPAK